MFYVLNSFFAHHKAAKKVRERERVEMREQMMQGVKIAKNFENNFL